MTIDRIQRRHPALLAEALATLGFASAAIRLLPFAWIGTMASRPPGRAPTAADSIAGVTWAVQAWARRVPWRAVCFQRGLAVQLMLRRRGLDSTLYFGVARRADAGLKAHVWVKVGDMEVIGCEEAPGYAVLAAFPGRGGASGAPHRFDDASPAGVSGA